jgi:quinol monooxygenase YgiN
VPLRRRSGNVAGFVQIIEFSTAKIDEVDALVEELRAAMEGEFRVRRSTETEDKDNPGRYVTIVEFDSWEEAMENSRHPTVTKFAERLANLAEAPVAFRNLDVRKTYENET